MAKLTMVMLDILKGMNRAERRSAFEDAEIVCEGVECWLGYRRVSRQTVNRLLKLLLISQIQSGKVARYSLNGLGREVLKMPSLADQVERLVAEGKPFTVSNGRVRRL